MFPRLFSRYISLSLSLCTFALLPLSASITWLVFRCLSLASLVRLFISRLLRVVRPRNVCLQIVYFFINRLFSLHSSIDWLIGKKAVLKVQNEPRAVKWERMPHHALLFIKKEKSHPWNKCTWFYRNWMNKTKINATPVFPDPIDLVRQTN